MKLGILITDNGTHSAEKWASALAEKIIVLAQDMEGERLIAALKMQVGIVQALENHHQTHKDEILSSLDSGTHFDSPIVHDAGDKVEQVLADIQSAAANTPWEDHFKGAEIETKLRTMINQSLVDLAHVERLFHLDKNPDDKEIQGYKVNPVGFVRPSVVQQQVSTEQTSQESVAQPATTQAEGVTV